MITYLLETPLRTENLQLRSHHPTLRAGEDQGDAAQIRQGRGQERFGQDPGGHWQVITLMTHSFVVFLLHDT